MRPVTLFTIQWGDLPLEEMCRQAQEMGYEGLELSASHLDMKRAASDPEYVKEVKDTLKKYGLGCWAISNHLAGQCVVYLRFQTGWFCPSRICRKTGRNPEVGN